VQIGKKDEEKGDDNMCKLGERKEEGNGRCKLGA